MNFVLKGYGGGVGLFIDGEWFADIEEMSPKFLNILQTLNTHHCPSCGRVLGYDMTHRDTTDCLLNVNQDMKILNERLNLIRLEIVKENIK